METVPRPSGIAGAFARLANLLVSKLKEDSAIMPVRPSHLPTTRERSTLQKLHADRGLPLARLHPAGKPAIDKMMIKGWIALDESKSSMTFRITAAGEAALKERLPIYSSRRVRQA
jgi:hypothetical protein